MDARTSSSPKRLPAAGPTCGLMSVLTRHRTNVPASYMASISSRSSLERACASFTSCTVGAVSEGG
jgi:hypothetical protein